MAVKGRITLITGGTGALGSVVAGVFLQSGAKVYCTWRRRGEWDEVRRMLNTYRGKLLGMKADATDEQRMEGVVKDIVAEEGRLDILLNIAGGYKGGFNIHETSVELWNSMMNLNLRTTFVSCKAVLPQMIKQNYGRIVNVSSRSAVERSPESGAYAVSKIGVVKLTETIAEEVAGYDINANCILPSIIDTPQNRRDMPKSDFSKWVDPEQIAKVILFLVSEDAKIINGAAVPVYGKA